MLEYLRHDAPGHGEGSPVLVALHGRGSHMGDLQALARVLPQGGVLLTPQAPHPGRGWGYGPGWAWYRYLGEDRPEPESLEASLLRIREFLEAMPEVLGFRPGPVVLGGFSQGGTTSVAYALRHPGTVAGVFNLSGFLVSADTVDLAPETLGDTPLFWGHGTEDASVPFSLALRGRERFRGVGGRVEERDYPMGHQVSLEEMRDLEDWLEREIAGWERRERS
jgi:phospholipase/carboxylesterase